RTRERIAGDQRIQAGKDRGDHGLFQRPVSCRPVSSRDEYDAGRVAYRRPRRDGAAALNFVRWLAKEVRKTALGLRIAAARVPSALVVCPSRPWESAPQG